MKFRNVTLMFAHTRKTLGPTPAGSSSQYTLPGQFGKGSLTSGGGPVLH